MKPTKKMTQSIPFQYAKDVRSGKIITGKWIKLAVDRFYNWLDEASPETFYLDHDDAMRYIKFFPQLLRHTKGKMAGQKFELAPFQQFTLYNVFGWKDKNGLRRINTVYDQRAKKNGKSAEMAGVSLEVMSIDGESEAEVYVGATKEDQAKICWRQAKQFIDSPLANPLLKELGFYTKQREIIFKPTQSVLMPLGGDSKTQDGINSHLAIIDEYHAHPTDAVKENLESSSVQRQQPITYHITTAGTNIASVCKQYADVCKDILQGIKKDNHTFIMIHELDEGDDWEAEQNWVKANPLLHQGLSIDNLRKEYIKAKNQPSKAPNFKTKHLNMWVDAPQIWIPNEIWMNNKTDQNYLKKFEELGSVSGADLSTTTDLTADAYLTYPGKDGKRYLKVYCYCPLDTIEKRSKEDRVPYRQWMDEGWLIATPGNTVDYNIFRDNKIKNQSVFNVKNNEFDKWNATTLQNELTEAGVPVSNFSQAISTISFPTKEFERLVYEGNIIHDGNPIVQWALASCVIYRDPNENIKVTKKLSHANGRRVDPIIAAIMALGGTMSEEPEDSESQYNNQDEAYI
jgi:phage terminase large subunit-like protein